MCSTLLKLVSFLSVIYLIQCATAGPTIKIATNKTYHYDNKKGNWVDKQINCELLNFNTTVQNLTIYKDNVYVYSENNVTGSSNLNNNLQNLMGNVTRVGFGKLLVTNRTEKMAGNYNFTVLYGTVQKPNFTYAVVYISGSSVLSAINYPVITLASFMYMVISKLH